MLRHWTSQVRETKAKEKFKNEIIKFYVIKIIYPICHSYYYFV